METGAPESKDEEMLNDEVDDPQPSTSNLKPDETELSTPSTSATKDTFSLKKDCMKTMLEVFASLGGLALVAQRLPTMTLDIGHESSSTDDAKPSPMQPPIMSHIQHQSIAEHFGHYGSTVPGWMEDEDWFGFDNELEAELPEELGPVVKIHPKPGTKKPPTSAIVSTTSHPCVPAHTMSALCLFLRVPHFADEFLSEQKQARCLLRLMLGVQDDGQGEQILKLDLAQSLPMLPFTAICSLLSKHGPDSASGMSVREAMTYQTTSIHLVLACLSRFTHIEPNEDTPAGRLLASLLPEQETAPINVAPPSYKGPIKPQGTPKKPMVSEGLKQTEKNYWAKGTGFGTGSTTSDWDVGNAVKKQKKDEGYITVLLEVLANFVCPEPKVEGESSEGKQPIPIEDKFATSITELLSASGLIPAIASYLRNDSVLDMAHHVPLYCSLLSVIRSFAVCPVLCRLLMDSKMTSKQSPDGSKEKSSSSDSILSLLSKMRKCIDTYASRLKAINTTLESQGEEGLTSFVLNVQKTESMLTKIAKELKLKDSQRARNSNSTSSTDSGRASPSGVIKLSLSSDSLERRYIDDMKQLQFDTSELVVEEDNGKLRFPSGHHYASHIKDAANVADASRARRLAQETVTLSNSLPLSHSSTVFVRCDEERLDVMKVLITGPSETPYANGCFEFDVFFPSDYNNSPPLVNLQTTGNHSVRFNPNLYNDGKVCLSILNTWHGRPEEKWNPQTSSFLQILVSIQSLILVSEPYFNEPGYERSRGTPAGKQSSQEYDSNIQQATVKWGMLEQLKNPSPCFKEVIEHHFWLKRTEILAQCDQWLADLKQQANERHGRRNIAHNYTALQRHVTQLQALLTKMKCPEGLEDTQVQELEDTQGETTQESSKNQDMTENDASSSEQNTTSDSTKVQVWEV
uniref:baculoviral IAP repeat-containing protein 6-like n=1 Tax=Styela clava TaxID=7725 RepID=UPI001939B142|nr:baculoviral IAP repeat-containing protein 6-like [Styela clava]